MPHHGRPGVETREGRFGDGLSRERNQDAFGEVGEEGKADQDHYDWMYRLQLADIPAGSVVFEDDAYNTPHPTGTLPRVASSRRLLTPSAAPTWILD